MIINFRYFLLLSFVAIVLVMVFGFVSWVMWDRIVGPQIVEINIIDGETYSGLSLSLDILVENAVSGNINGRDVLINTDSRITDQIALFPGTNFLHISLQDNIGNQEQFKYLIFAQE